MAVEVRMPQLGESVHEGTIGKWLKVVGDSVAEHEPLLEVVTDKVDTEIASPTSGTLLHIVAREGDTVRVGTTMAWIGAPGEAVADGSVAAGSDVALAPVPAPAVAVPAAPALAPAAAPSPASAGSSETRVSPVAARVAADLGIDPSALPGTGPSGRVMRADVERAVESVAAAAMLPQAIDETAHEGADAGAGFVSPRASRRAIELGVDLRQVRGTGAGGRITARDVESAAPGGPPGEAPAPARVAVASPQAAQPPAGIVGEVVPLTPIRRAIAEHMVRSKHAAPHVSTVHEVDMSAVLAAVQALKAPFAERGVKLTITACIVQAVAEALIAHPGVNSSWTDEGIRIHPDVNIGLAVAIPTGLIVPVLRHAGEKSLLGLAREVSDLTFRARNKQLKPDDVQGGTFTISNYGTLGSLFGTPVINQPQAGILGTGAIRKRVVVVEGAAGDTIAIRPMMFLALTFDHRILDGGTADPFVQTVVRKLESYSA